METVSHPGQVLKTRFLDPLGISPYRLAKSINVHVSRVSKLIRGERALTADTAIRLGLYFGVPARWWMELQTTFELDDDERVERLRRVVVPLERPSHTAIGPGGARFFRPPASEPTRRTTVSVSAELLAMLEAQAALVPARGEREVKSVEYGNGYKAVVGASG